MAKPPALQVTGDPVADRLVSTNALALLIGMLLDQQVPMEWAFRGPLTLQERIGELDATAIAEMDPDKFEAICREKPAIHRFPKAMAKRIQELCAVVSREYGNNAAKVWKGAPDPDTVFVRLRALPGYGDEKAKIFLAILGKRLQVAPAGWEPLANPFSDATPRSVADIGSPAALATVRAWKKQQKAKGKSKQD
ncbi:MAG: HhH-GPD-type base excision DNA repair protein [Acidimicrobiia bacterium]